MYRCSSVVIHIVLTLIDVAVAIILFYAWHPDSTSIFQPTKPTQLEYFA